MSPAKIIYHWFRKVSKTFPSLTKPEARVLALFSFGVARAQRCTLTKVAEQLEREGKVDTVERRLQCFLDNPKVDWQLGCQNLAGWVLSHLVFPGPDRGVAGGRDGFGGAPEGHGGEPGLPGAGHSFGLVVLSPARVSPGAGEAH